MCSTTASGGSIPWERHTTIGVAHASHSATQHTSSSWNHGEIRAASHSSQSVALIVADASFHRVSARSTAAYADVPKSGTGPGVLVLHSWWGLTDSVRDRCNHLADAGFTALAPDLFDGVVATDVEHGRSLLNEIDANQLAMSVKSCADALRRMPATPDGPIMVVGFSMGASLGLWLSEREPDGIDAVVGHYGTQGIDFTATRSRYQLHMTIDDPLIDPDELALMEASLRLAERPVEIHVYEGAAHNFAEPEAPGYDARFAGQAWERTIEFLSAGR